MPYEATVLQVKKVKQSAPFLHAVIHQAHNIAPPYVSKSLLSQVVSTSVAFDYLCLKHRAMQKVKDGARTRYRPYHTPLDCYLQLFGEDADCN